MACAHYELDMKAAKFGDCKCGHSKVEHSQESLHSQPPHAIHHQATPAAAPPPPPESRYHGPCDEYKVDMNAAEFGLCHCGFKKIDHGKDKSLFTDSPPPPKPAPPPRVVVDAPPPVKTTISPLTSPKGHRQPSPKGTREEKPCDNYAVDVTGTFGFCYCGWSREDHKRAGTFHEPEAPVFAGGHIADIKRSTITHKGGAPAAPPSGKQAKPCDNYHVDMQGQTFGDCTCGHARAKHKQYQDKKKFQNNDPDEEDQVPEPAPAAPRVIVRTGLNQPCEEFELDLKNGGGYGHCLCGFSRIDHEKFHHDPDEWLKVKSHLTPPKEFT